MIINIKIYVSTGDVPLSLDTSELGTPLEYSGKNKWLLSPPPHHRVNLLPTISACLGKPDIQHTPGQGKAK